MTDAPGARRPIAARQSRWAPRLSRAALPVVRGRPRPWMKHAGYASTRADRISLRLTSPIVVDGEVFDPGPHGHVELSAGPVVEFHRY